MVLIDLFLTNSPVWAFVVPLLMTVIGVVWLKKPPKKINSWYGYRTNLSTSSQEAWDFANRHCATIFIKVGIVMLAVSTVILILYHSHEVVIFLTIAQPIVLMAAAAPTNKALKDKFGG